MRISPLILMCLVLPGCAHGQCVMNGNTREFGTTQSCPATNPLVSVTVAPSSAQIADNQSATFTAVATFSDGTQSTVTSSAAWASSNTSIATVSGSLATCGASADGAATITATYQGVQGTASLTCLPLPVITTTTLPGATQGTAYSSGNICATGGAQPYSWSVTSGTLPDVTFVLNSASPCATITAPSNFTASAGSYPFTLQVQEAGGHTGQQLLSITVSTPGAQLPSLPTRWVNGRAAWETAPNTPITYADTITVPSVSTWACHATNYGPYAGTLAGLNQAEADVETCRTANCDSGGYEIKVAHTVAISQNFTSANYFAIQQNNGDSCAQPIRVTSDTPLPTTDPVSGDPRDQLVGTYNLADTNPCVRSSNIVTCTLMNPAPVPFVAGELATVFLTNDLSFQGRYTILASPAPTTTQFSYAQTGPNATSPGCANGNLQCFAGDVESVQAQSPIQAESISGCTTTGSNTGAACTVTLDFASNPNFAVGNRFDIVGSVCSGCISADANALNSTFYVATVTSDANCSTCRITFNTYTEAFGNSATWPTPGMALHFNHIPQDQIKCCMFTLQTTGGSNELVGPAQNNPHNFEMDSFVLSMAPGTTAGIPEYIRMAPIGYDQSPTPVMHTSGCDGTPNHSNCDEPVQFGINNYILIGGSYADPCTFPNFANTNCTATRGIELDCTYCFATNGRMEYIHQQGAESHGISGSGIKGPWKVVNNLIEGTSEAIFPSYLPKVLDLPNGYFCDGEIRRNRLTVNMFDILNSGTAIPGGTTKYFSYVEKNRIEFKNACDELVAGNIIGPSAGGAGEQQGALFGNNSTANNGTQTQPQLGSQSHDVMYYANWWPDGAEGGYYPARSNLNDTVNFPTYRYAWLYNLFSGIGNPPLYSRNCWSWTALNWSAGCSFLTVFQFANRGQEYAQKIVNKDVSPNTTTFVGVCSGSQTGGVASMTCGEPQNCTISGGVTTCTNTCVTPVGSASSTPCGTGFQAGDWVTVFDDGTGNCPSAYWSTSGVTISTAISSDPTLSNPTFQYAVSPAAPATASHCIVSNVYGFPRNTTIEHNTVVANWALTNAEYNNTLFANTMMIAANANMGGCGTCATNMARDAWIRGNVFSAQISSTQVQPRYFYSAANSKEGTLGEQALFDTNSFMWTGNAIGGYNGLSGFSASNYTEYNCPAGVCGPNNGASPPVTDLFVTNSCPGSPNNSCIGFKGNYQTNTWNYLGGSGNQADVAEFAPSGSWIDLFTLNPLSYFAAGNGGQAWDGTDSGYSLSILQTQMGEQQFVCGVNLLPSCTGTPYP